MLRMSSGILAVNIEVAGYSEMLACVFRVTWRLVLGGSNLEEFSSARHCPMCPSSMSLFMFEAPSSPDIPSPHTCQVAPCRRLESRLLLHHTVFASLACSLYLD